MCYCVRARFSLARLTSWAVSNCKANAALLTLGSQPTARHELEVVVRMLEPEKQRKMEEETVKMPAVIAGRQCTPFDASQEGPVYAQHTQLVQKLLGAAMWCLASNWASMRPMLLGLLL